MRRVVGLVLLGLLPAGRIAAQPPECEPLSIASIEGVAARDGLDDEQARWLTERFRAGRLRDPADLDGLPGMGTELRDLLAGAWCWEAAAEAGSGTRLVSLAARRRPAASRRDVRAEVKDGGIAGRLRLRTADTGERTVRGGLRMERSRWHLAAGTLRRRSGLGLLIATPGAEPRGDAPLRPDNGGWRPSTALDPAIVRGVTLGHAGPRWRVDGAAVHGNDGDRVMGSVTRDPGGGLYLGLDAVTGTGRWGGALRVGAGNAAHRWRIEFAMAGRAAAQGGAWQVRQGDVRLAASVVHEGAGFISPGRRLPSREPRDGAWLWIVSGRWQGGPGRFVEVGLLDRMRPDGGLQWLQARRQFVVDVGERIRPGVTGVFRWRVRRTGAVGAPDPVRDRLSRLELALVRSGWRARMRLEERIEASRRADIVAVHWGREGRLAWEMRGIRLRGDPEARVWWHRRRAGGQYGWDALGPGTWLGGWLSWRGGAFRLQVSGDAHPAGWELTASVEWLRGA